jgi:hypothetical protein
LQIFLLNFKQNKLLKMKTITSVKGIISTCVLSSVLLLTACSKNISDPAVQPTLTTSAATSITSSGAVLGGNVTSLGNQNIQIRGVVVATNANPITTADISFYASGSGLGPYTCPLVTTLAPNTLYHMRAFIQTDSGVSYGNDLTFTTLP